MKVRDTIAIGVECFRKLIKFKSLFPLASHVLNHASLSSLDLAVVQGKKFSTALLWGRTICLPPVQSWSWILPAMPGYDTRQTLTFLTVGLTGTGKSELCHWMTGNSEKLF